MSARRGSSNNHHVAMIIARAIVAADEARSKINLPQGATELGDRRPELDLAKKAQNNLVNYVDPRCCLLLTVYCLLLATYRLPPVSVSVSVSVANANHHWRKKGALDFHASLMPRTRRPVALCLNFDLDLDLDLDFVNESTF